MRFVSQKAVQAAWRLVGAVVLGAVPAGPIAAGSYPETALSLALSMPPELVDEASLLFQLPSRAGISRTQMFAFSGSPYYSESASNTLGAIGQTHGHGFFLLVQPSALLTSAPEMQAGWGGAWRRARVGIAARTSEAKAEDSNYYGNYTPPQSYSTRTLQRVREASAGVGFGDGRFVLDLAVDLKRFDETIERSSNDVVTTVLDLDSGDDLSYGLSGRFQLRPGESIEITAAGGWSRVEGELNGTKSESAVVDTIAVGRTFESWSGGLAIAFPVTRVDWFGVAAYWSRRETLPRYYNSSEVGKSSFERVALAFSMREELWRDLWAQAGINMRYEEEGTDRSFDSYYDDIWSRTTTTRLATDFSWGVSYAWKYFEGRASLRETLPLENLFANLDFFVRF